MAKKTAGKTIKMNAAQAAYKATDDMEINDKVATAILGGAESLPFTGQRDGKAWYAGMSCSPRIFQALVEVEHAQQVFNNTPMPTPNFHKPMSVNDLANLAERIRKNPKLQWADSAKREKAEAQYKGLMAIVYKRRDRGDALVEKCRFVAAEQCCNDGEDTSPYELEQLAQANFGRIDNGFISAGCRTETVLGKDGKSYVNAKRYDKTPQHTEMMLEEAKALVAKSQMKAERFENGTYTITDEDGDLLGEMMSAQGFTNTKGTSFEPSPEEEEINEAAMLDAMQSNG